MTPEEKIETGISYAEEQANKGCSPLMDQVIKESSKDKKIKILDFGCGFGGHSLLYSRYKNCEVYAMDIDPTHIAVSEELKKKHGMENVTFHKRNILEDPLKEEERFDLVFFNDVIEHIPIAVLSAILAQIRNHLTTDGKIFMGYPPWESPYAAHVYWAVKIPWIQYLPDKTVRRIIAKNNQQIVGAIESDLIEAYDGLNRITHKKAMKIVDETSLSPVLRKSHCILNRVGMFKDVNFGFFPFKYLITYEILILQNLN